MNRGAIVRLLGHVDAPPPVRLCREGSSKLPWGAIQSKWLHEERILTEPPGNRFRFLPRPAENFASIPEYGLFFFREGKWICAAKQPDAAARAD